MDEERLNTLKLLAFLQPSPVFVFEVCSAETPVVLVLLVTSLEAPTSSSLSPVDSSSDDSLKKWKGKKNMVLNTGDWISKVTVLPHPRG